jgi:serine phosphatase RsbU (regulator of sigma subunit)
MIAGLVSLTFYEMLEGEYPLPSLQFDDLTLGLTVVLINWAVGVLVHLPYLVYLTFLIRQSPELKIGSKNFAWLSAISLGVNLLIDPFGVLGAGIYSGEGIWAFLMFAAGLLLICVLLHQLSKSVEHSQQRSREMELLEQLGREIINGPPDASNLPELLKTHVPPMFPSSDISIHLYPNRPLLNRASLRSAPNEAFWEWLSKQTESVTIKAKEIPAWQDTPIVFSILAVPILDSETHEILGGIYFSGLRIGKMDLFVLPIQSLAAQIASALHSAKVYEETLAHQKVAQELAFAGQVQASFLPSELPQVNGWQLAATIDPARETSGDFYDLITLPNGKIGFVVADVADKGTGAAIFMALSRTLIRTYAFEHPDEPEIVLGAANQRILQDTRNNLFVTVFYGVLNPVDGILTYASAGHNPAFVVNMSDGKEVQKLMKTGIPMGMFDTAKWKQQTYQLAPADVLIMYTDGVTEAQDMQGNLYSEDRLLKTIHANRSLPCDGLRDTVVTDIHQFVNGAPQSDDITLMLVLRNPN